MNTGRVFPQLGPALPDRHAEYREPGMSEAAVASVVRELGRLQNLVEADPAPSVSTLTVAFTPGEPPQFVVQLPAAPMPSVIRSLLEWTSSLHRTATLVWRTSEGDAAEIGVRGRIDYGGPSIQVWSRPVPFRKLGGISAPPGTLTVLDTEAIHMWAHTPGSSHRT